MILAVLIQGCATEEPSVEPQGGPPPKEEPAPAQEVKAQQPAPPSAEAEEPKNTYTYDPEGRPDPFKSILLTGIAKSKEFLPPLQQREISEMRLIAIIWGGLGRKAMVQMPDGKGYTIQEGTRLGPNRGRVRRITTNEVVIEERYTDFFGEQKTREIVLQLRPAGESRE